VITLAQVIERFEPDYRARYGPEQVKIVVA